MDVGQTVCVKREWEERGGEERVVGKSRGRRSGKATEGEKKRGG